MNEGNYTTRPFALYGNQERVAHRYAQLTCFLLAGGTLFHLWYIRSGAMDLAPDEAQYWEWSRRLDWSYYSKGPFVAYLIAASTRLGGNTEFFVRLPAVLLALGTGLLIYALTVDLFARERAAFLAVLAAAAIPLYGAGSILMTTDAPLVFFWMLAVVCVAKALATGKRRGRGWWVLLAVALGCGVSAKYTMLLFMPCLVAFLWTSPLARPHLRDMELYVALVGSCLFFAPLLVWNAAHGWVSLQHVLRLAGVSPGVSPTETHFAAKTFFEYFGSQLIVISPLLFVAVISALIRCGRLGIREERDDLLLLFMFSAPALGFFLLWSIYEKVEANWAAFAYLTATIAVAGWWDEQLSNLVMRRRVVRRIAAILLPGFILVGVSHFPGVLRTAGIPLPPEADPTRRLHGWKELGVAVGKHITSSGRDDLFLMSDQYQIASELAFYVPGQPQVYNINLGRRMNQYDIWGGLEAHRGQDGLFVTYGDWPAPALLHEACESADRIEIVDTFHGGRVAQVFSIFRCGHYRGLPSLPGRVTY